MYTPAFKKRFLFLFLIFSPFSYEKQETISLMKRKNDKGDESLEHPKYGCVPICVHNI